MSEAAGVASVHPAMRRDNIHLPRSGGDNISRVLLGAGVAGVGAVLLAPLTEVVSARHALMALLVGIGATLAISLGAMLFVMIFHLTMAGWCSTIRRQFENLMAVMWVPAGLLAVFLGVVWAMGGLPHSWMDPHLTAGDPLFEHKHIYFEPWFVALRLALYTAVIGGLAVRLWRLSRLQDRTGDRWLTNRLRDMSSWGLVLTALAMTFFAIDWLKAITDYHFFSTMWGVYYFAGSAYSSLPLVVIVLTALRARGRLEGVVTEEHFHDLGKLMFGFTVFWAYIAFGQYFLIWYANLPEETAWFLHRKTDAWAGWSVFLATGHFIVPFFVLLFRAVRRNPRWLSAIGAWMLLMHVVDVYWVVRPAVDLGEGHPAGLWGPVVDVAAVAGVLALYLGALIRFHIARGPLVPLHDPRLPEGLRHKNYI